MDPYICCLLGLCCPPNSPEQLNKLTAMLIKIDGRRTQAFSEEMAQHDLALVKRIKDAILNVMSAP